MPRTQSETGVRLYGRTNTRQYYDVCEFCSRSGSLASYEVTRCAVLFSIPLIPLGKCCVVRECHACGERRVLTPRERDAGKDEAVAKAKNQCRANPTDAEVARKAIATLADHQAEAAFLELAPDVIRNFSGDAEILKMIGSVFAACFRRHAEAVPVLRRVLELEDSPDVREMLAPSLIRQGELDEAASLLQHVAAKGLADRVALLLLLAEAFEDAGNHKRALRTLAQCLTVDPFVDRRRSYWRIRNAVERGMLADTPHKDGRPAPADLLLEDETDAAARLAKFVGPALLAALLALYCGLAFMKGRNREVHLLNGLTRPYTVRVNGKSHRLPALGWAQVRLSEGVVTIETETEDLPVPDRQIEIRTPFFARPFLKRRFVINPDASAVLVRQEVWFAKEPGKGREPSFTYYAGEPLYAFGDVDYMLENFPQDVPMRGDAMVKERIALLGPNVMAPSAILRTVAMELGKGKAMDLAQRLLEFEPHNPAYLQFLHAVMAPDEFIELLKPGLAARPVRVEWHRHYQESVESAQPEHDLTAEYRELLTRAPENPSLQYLLGRLLRDAEESVRLFRQSVQGATPSAYGHHALAFHYLGTGEFEKAFQHSAKAVNLNDRSPFFHGTHMQALLATARHDEALAKIREQMRGAPPDPGAVLEEIQIWVAKGDVEGARETIMMRLRTMAPANDARALESLKTFFHAQLAYCTGDLARYVELLGDANSPDVRFTLALSQGKLDEAQNALLGLPPNFHYRLLLYTACQRAGKTKSAQEHVDVAVDILRTGNRGHRTIADFLTGKKPFTLQELHGLSLDLFGKAVCSTALGTMHPDQRDACYALVRKLNFRLLFPHLFLKQMVGEETK